MKRYTVLEIDTPKAFEIVQSLDPTYKEIPYEEAHLSFFILDFPQEGVHSIVKPEQLEGTLETGIKLKILTLFQG